MGTQPPAANRRVGLQPRDRLTGQKASRSLDPLLPSAPRAPARKGPAARRYQSEDVYAQVGTYPEELRLAAGVSLYGGYGPAWQRSLSTRTRITGATTGSGDTEGAFALNVAAPTTVQLVTVSPSTPTGSGASSYGLR